VTGILIASPTLLFPRKLQIISFPLFGMGFFLGKTILDRYTPISHIESAEYELSEVAAYSLVCRQWAGDDKRVVLDTVENIYVEERWPLVSAFDDLVSCRDRLSWACDWANKAAREDRVFVERADLVNRQANSFFKNIAVALKIIKSSPKYEDQLSQFEEDRRHQEEIRVRWQETQAQMASAKAQEVAAVVQQQTQQAAAQLEEDKRRQEEMRIKYQERLAQQKIAEAHELAAIVQQQVQQTAAQQKIAEAEMKIKLEQLQAQQKMVEDQMMSAKAQAIAQKQAQQAAAQIEEDKRRQEEMRIKYQQLLAQQKIAINAKAQQETVTTQKPQQAVVQKEVAAEPCYKSESCCVCLENFDETNGTTVKRVFLRRCGHDICKNCAQQLFFGSTKATTCPQCRASVDRERLQLDLKR